MQAYNAVTVVDKELCDGRTLEAGSKIMLFQRHKGVFEYYCDEDKKTLFKRDEFEKLQAPNVDESTVEGFKNYFNVELFGYNPESKTWPIAKYVYESGGECNKHYFDCKLQDDEVTFVATDINQNIVNEDLLDFEPEYHDEEVTFDRGKFSAVKVDHTDAGNKVWTIFGFDKHSNKLLKFLMEQVVAVQEADDTKDNNSEHDLAFAESILASHLVTVPSDQ